MAEHRRKVILDCDPGIDDATAIMMIKSASDKLDLLGITTTCGNQTIDCVSENALRITDFLNLDTPVAIGADSPLLREKVNAGHIHGKAGLGNEILPKCERKFASQNAVLFLFNTIMNLPENEKVTIIATAPLTNIALLLKAFPCVKERIELLSIMGGSASDGNVTPYAEFNIWDDPEAAQIVFSSGVPIVLSGLDVTSFCGPLCKDVSNMARSNNSYVSFVGRMLEFYVNVRQFKPEDIVSVHDVSAVMYLLYPHLYTGKYAKGTVCTEYNEYRGKTSFDFDADKGQANIKVLLSVDKDEYRRLFFEHLERL